MKSRLFVLLMILGTSLFGSNFMGKEVERGLEVTYSYYEDEWILGLSDGSHWELMPLTEKRKQTWSEWWKNVDPQEWSLSDEFFFDQASWKGKYKISVYEATHSLKSNYDFILINEANQEKAFARFLPYGSQAIPKIGFAKGFFDGAKKTPTRISASDHILNNKDIVVLEDQTAWRLYLSTPNSRSFSQWWNGETIDQPDNEFISELNDWHTLDEIIVYRAQSNENSLFEKYKIAKKDQQIFLIENVATKKIAYAESIPLHHLIGLYQEQFKSAYDDGWREGHLQGLLEGERTGRLKGERSGWADGYTEGYENGLRDGEI